MDIVYTNHAEDQITERKIEKIWVEEAVKWPHHIQRDGDKYSVIRKLNGFTLQVIYVKERYIKIITAFFIQ